MAAGSKKVSYCVCVYCACLCRVCVECMMMRDV